VGHCEADRLHGCRPCPIWCGRGGCNSTLAAECYVETSRLVAAAQDTSTMRLSWRSADHSSLSGLVAGDLKKSFSMQAGSCRLDSGDGMNTLSWPRVDRVSVRKRNISSRRLGAAMP
jgi:hypothetical protein